jgi:ribosomal protein S6--L-glutamate ligase
MRFAILGTKGWHAEDLRRAVIAAGHECHDVDFRLISARVACGADPLMEHDGIFVRTMPPGSLEQVVFRMDVLHQLVVAGLRVLNPPAALEACVDKFLASARFGSARLPTPATRACQTCEDAMTAFAELGSDVVVKPLFGSEGRGISRITDPELAWRTFRTLERLQAVMYLQEFISHPGWDLRVFVVGGKVVAAMRRYGSKGWRTNVAQGGRPEVVTPPLEAARLACQAAQALGALVAGVDILQTPEGPFTIVEGNAVPGWRALSAVSGLDVAREIVRFMIDWVEDED